MENLVHSESYKGFKIKIYQDTDAENPDSWDNAGKFCHWHKRGFIGEDLSRMEQEDIQARVDKLREDGAVILPVYLYEHSGQTISTKPFACPWDSGQVGFCYATKKEIEDEWAGDKDKAREYLKGQVATWDDYLRGNIYGFVIEDGEGEHVESCWGFYGDHDSENGCLAEARSLADYLDAEKVPLFTATKTDCPSASKK